MSQESKPSQNLSAIWDEIDSEKEHNYHNRGRLKPIGSERSESRSSEFKIKFGHPDIETSWNNNDDLAFIYPEDEASQKGDEQNSTTSSYEDVRKELYISGQLAFVDDSASSMQNFNVRKNETEIWVANTKFKKVYHCPSNYQHIDAVKIQKRENTMELNKEEYRDRGYETSDDNIISHHKQDKDQYNQCILINNVTKAPVDESPYQCNDEYPIRNCNINTKTTDVHNKKRMDCFPENKLTKTTSKGNREASTNYNDRGTTEITNRKSGGNACPQTSHDNDSYRNTSNMQNRVKFNSNDDISYRFIDNDYDCRQKNENVKDNYMKQKRYLSSDTEKTLNERDGAFRGATEKHLQNSFHENIKLNNKCFDNGTIYKRAYNGKSRFENGDKKFNRFGNNRGRYRKAHKYYQHNEYVSECENELPTTTQIFDSNHTKHNFSKDNQCYDRYEANKRISKPQIVHHIVRHEIKVSYEGQGENRNMNKSPLEFKNKQFQDEYEQKGKAEKYCKNRNKMEDWKANMIINPGDIIWKIINQKTVEERELKEEHGAESEEENELKSGGKTNKYIINLKTVEERERKEENGAESKENNRLKSGGKTNKYIKYPKPVKKINIQMLQSALNSVSDCNSDNNWYPPKAKHERLQTHDTKTFPKAETVDDGYAYTIDTSITSKSSRNTATFTSKSKELIHYAKEISDLVCGCHQALQLFLGVYHTEWIKARLNTIEILDNLIKEVLETGKEGRLKNFFKFIGIGGKIAGAAELTGMVPKYVGITCTVVGKLAEMLAKYCETSTIEFSAKKFEIIKAFQHDVDVSDYLYIYALQCDEQFLETKKIIDDFYHNVERGEYNDVASELGLKYFFEQILYLEKSHPSFHKQFYFAMKRLCDKSDESETRKAFSRVFDEHPEEMVVLKSLNWRCNMDASGNSKLKMGWEEVSALLDNTTASNKGELVKKLCECNRVFEQEETSLKNKVKLLSDD